MDHENLIYRDIVRVDPGLLSRLMRIHVADICDILPVPVSASALMHSSIRSVTPGLAACGQAITAFVADGDGLIPHVALYLAKAGDVLVLSNGPQDTRSALCGGNGGLNAKTKGLAGAVCDGAVRDVAALREMGFPTWSRSTTASHGPKNGAGWVNKPVSCGGVVVNPGDIVIADDDGIISFSPVYAEFIAREADRIHDRDKKIQKRIASGEHIFEMANLGTNVKIVNHHWQPNGDTI